MWSPTGLTRRNASQVGAEPDLFNGEDVAATKTGHESPHRRERVRRSARMADRRAGASQVFRAAPKAACRR
jgi:hypothetical protein